MLKKSLFLILCLGLSACTIREYREEKAWGVPTHVNEEVTSYHVDF